ncbi:MAG TPA: hypothetical protein VMG61_12750 [Usitatibacter sp.]|nr:hypothetical protein [Usitatibacter sp.]
MTDDDLRNHDPNPTDEERAWMETDPIAAVRRIAVLIVLAFSVAGYLGYATDGGGKPEVLAARQHP